MSFDIINSINLLKYYLFSIYFSKVTSAYYIIYMISFLNYRRESKDKISIKPKK